jgi:acid phosphatase (class A)
MTVLGLALALTAAGAAMSPCVAASAPKKPGLTASKFLQPGELDPAQLLPRPPGDDSPETKAELAELHRIEAARTPERFELAKHDDEFEDVTSIAAPLGPAFDLARFPATAALFEDVRLEDEFAGKRFKSFFARPRPDVLDPSLNPCERENGKNSYPSGHSTIGYSAATVLSELMPGNAQVIQARAAEFAESRLVCGAHYRRDIEAGHVLGVALALELMKKPKFREELEAARAELTAAHIAP